MLTQRIRSAVESMLRPGESVVEAMVGFRPLSRSSALLMVFVTVFLGFAVSSAADIPAWIGGGVGGGVGAGLAMLLDQARARREHGGKGMSVGLVVTTQRFFILELAMGAISATVAGVDSEAELTDIRRVEIERMQGSGLKRPGVVLTFSDGSESSLIPARTKRLIAALGH